MSQQSRRILLGVLLVVAGAAFLLQQLLEIPIGGLFIAFLFVLAGCVFQYFLLRDRHKWWLAIPGFTLIGIGGVILIKKLLPNLAGDYSGAFFLLMVALGFLVVFLLNQAQWWPIIPAGILATLALVSALGLNGMANGGLLFLGIGATFTVLGLMPVGKAEKWPWIPAGICLLLGLILFASSGALMGSAAGWVFALVLIAAGAYFVIRSLIKKA